MNKNNEEKSLIIIEKDNIFIKIKKFIEKLFLKKQDFNRNFSDINKENIDSRKEEFFSYIKNIENEETILLKLQKEYRNGQIKEEELSEEQVEKLSQLYDRQLEALKKSNEIREKRILEYKRKLQEEC